MLSSCHMISSGLHCFKCCILRWSFCPIRFQLACCAILWNLLKVPVHYISVSERQSVPTANQISILWHQGQLEGACGKKIGTKPCSLRAVSVSYKKTMAAFFFKPTLAEGGEAVWSVWLQIYFPMPFSRRNFCEIKLDLLSFAVAQVWGL